MRRVLFTISMLLVMGLLVGCLGLQIKPSHDSERTARILSNVAESATLLVLKGKPDCTEFSKKVKKDIDFVRDTLDEPDVAISSVALEALISKLENLDTEYEVLMRVALDTLHEFVKIPEVDDVLSADAIIYLKAFFDGVNSGLEFEIDK